MLLGALIALLVLGGAAAAIALLAGRGSSNSSTVPTRGSLVNALPGAGAVARLLAGIPQHGTVLGSPSAPVTLVEYIDLQCPFCRDFETQSIPTIIRRFVKPGKLKIEARPIAILGPDSQTGRSAALAAAEQDRLFNFAQILYLNQGTENTGWLNAAMITAAAASIPALDVPRLLRDRKTAPVRAEEKTLDHLAIAARVQQTPTILVGPSGAKPKEVTVANPADPAPVTAAVERALAH